MEKTPTLGFLEFAFVNVTMPIDLIGVVQWDSAGSGQGLGPVIRFGPFPVRNVIDQYVQNAPIVTDAKAKRMALRIGIEPVELLMAVVGLAVVAGVEDDKYRGL